MQILTLAMLVLKYLSKTLPIIMAFFIMSGIQLSVQAKPSSIMFVADEGGEEVQIESEEGRVYDPSTAAILSTILPGAGQVYNRSFWKVPVVYGGFAVIAYGIHFNHGRYTDFRDAYKIRLKDDPDNLDPYHPSVPNDLPKYAHESQLLAQREYYRRNRDLFIISSVVLYALNIVDAYVDAHLKEFEISDDLSLKIQPANFINLAGQTGVTTGITLSF
jgi:hypothetical protein